jgi:putative hemolysin
VDGRLSIERFEELVDMKLEAPDGYNTLAGFVIGYLERIPEKGEIVEMQKIKFEVLEIIGNRLARLKVNK